ncbi:MAG: Gfo/Idh/MocA family oxidoreductase [Clostridia bacterium]|nr:Gfo/Idh/MocA family oxidoreductase [Clostridia bacterium]
MKIGLIGTGAMGKTHIYSVNNIPFFFDTDLKPEIIAVCTRKLEKARGFAEKYNIPTYTNDENDLIQNKEIDVIDICTPNIYHYETAKKAILAGKSVYCEKPLGVTYEQAKELAELTEKNGVFCGMVFNNRFLSPIIRAKELVTQGKIGKILSFNVKYYHSSALDTNKNAGWKQDSSICGGGVLFDLGSHVVDLVYYLCGNFKSVIGKSQIAYPVRRGINGEEWQTNADEAFHIIATLECGALGTISVSKIAQGTNDDLTLEIYGEKGSIKFDLMNPNFFEYYSTEAQEGAYGGERGFTKIECVNRYPHPGGVFPGIKAPIGWLRGHIGNYFAFLEAVKNKETPCPSFQDGAYVQKVLEIAYKSDKSGREEQIQ